MQGLSFCPLHIKVLNVSREAGTMTGQCILKANWQRSVALGLEALSFHFWGLGLFQLNPTTNCCLEKPAASFQCFPPLCLAEYNYPAINILVYQW